MDPTGGGFLQPGERHGPRLRGALHARAAGDPDRGFERRPADDRSTINARDRGPHRERWPRQFDDADAPPPAHARGGAAGALRGQQHPDSRCRTPAATTTPSQPFLTQRNIERQDVGVSLRVKPTVGEAGGVRLELEVDVTSLAPSLAGDVEEVGPTIRQRRLTSTIHLRDGEFAVVGFAREEGFTRGTMGVPWLKDIPLLGWAFKSTSDTNITTRLVIAAQARIERSRRGADRGLDPPAPRLRAGEQPSRACRHHRRHELGAARRDGRRPGRGAGRSPRAWRPAPGRRR